MANEPVLLLTPLRKEGHNFKGATSAGSWQPLSGTLGELGKALDVDDAADVDVVRSTPDPWSQARSFADAVLNPATQRTDIVGQWRGLLALFALSEHLKDSYKLELTGLALKASKTRFADVMLHLLPQTSLPPTDDLASPGWDNPYLIKLTAEGQGRYIGLLNPACLVAGGRDVAQWRNNNVPWMRHGLSDPTALTGTDKLRLPALLILGEYLKRLDDTLKAQCAGKGRPEQEEVLKTLSGRLQDFRKDCLDPVKFPGIDSYKLDMEAGEFAVTGLPALYQLFVVPIAAKSQEESECVVRLRSDLGGAAPFKGLVLLDPALAQPSAGRPATAITFWKFKTLQQVMDCGASEREALRKDIAKDGYLMVTLDDLFTSVMVQMNDDDQPARILAHPEGLQDCLLPLSPLALMISSAIDLPSRITINRDGWVSMQLSVGGQLHKVSRRYVKGQPQSGEGQLIDEVDWGLGDFAIWPDFRSDAWIHYCARIEYASNLSNRLRGRFGMSGALMAALLREVPEQRQRAERTVAWTSGRPIENGGNSALLDSIPEFRDRKFMAGGLTRLRASNSGGKASEIQIASAPFEAACFTIIVNPDEPPTPAGLSLLQIKPIEDVHDKSGNVAVDFGTTNTVACINDTGPARFAARVVHPLYPAIEGGLAKRASELAQKFKDFLPPDERTLPTPTVVIGRGLDQGGREAVAADQDLSDHPFIRQLMYFQPDFAENGTISAVPLEEWSSLLRSISYNLKWSKSKAMNLAAKTYLQQLMLMIACEWASNGGHPVNLAWHFSRPRDMGDDANFMNVLKSALSNIVPGVDQGAIRPIKYEGDAAAAYILDEKTKTIGTKGAINIILDIGGGTTDISIWDNGREPRKLLSASLRMAGGDFFTDHIMQNPEILIDFGLPAWTDIIRSMHADSDGTLKDNIHYIGELLFSGKALDRAISRHWAVVADMDNVRLLKETSFLFLGGVAWLIGRQLGGLIRDNQLPIEALDDIAVALCGRGSGLFVRLHGDDPRAVTVISRILRIVAAAAGQTRAKYPQVQVSPYPKIEVAAGMIIAARSEGAHGAAAGVGSAKADEPDEIIMDLGNGSLQRSSREEDASFSTMAVDVGIEDLDLFLSVFGQVSGCKINVSDHQRSKLVNGVKDIDRDDEINGRPQQSEFAALLKGLVGLMRLPAEDGMRPATSWT